jgi:hypothetical protein
MIVYTGWGGYEYTESSILRNANLRNHWWGGARKRINQKGSESQETQ